RVPEEAGTIIETIARDRGAPLVPAWDGVAAPRIQAPSDAPTKIRLTTPDREYGEITVALRGDHQIENAVVAVRLLEQLDQGGLAVPVHAIADGLAHVAWPGRLEHRRLSDGREMILDAAHNPAGAATLATYLASFAPRPPLVF